MAVERRALAELENEENHIFSDYDGDQVFVSAEAHRRNLDRLRIEFFHNGETWTPESERTETRRWADLGPDSMEKDSVRNAYGGVTYQASSWNCWYTGRNTETIVTVELAGKDGTIRWSSDLSSPPEA